MDRSAASGRWFRLCALNIEVELVAGVGGELIRIGFGRWVERAGKGRARRDRRRGSKIIKAERIEPVHCPPSHRWSAVVPRRQVQLRVADIDRIGVSEIVHTDDACGTDQVDAGRYCR